MNCSNAATRRAGLYGSLEWDARKLRASHRHGGTGRKGQSETSLITMSMRFSMYTEAAQTASHIPVQKQHFSAPSITLRSRIFSAQQVRYRCSCAQHFRLHSRARQFSLYFRRPDRTPESDDAGNRSRIAKQSRGVLPALLSKSAPTAAAVSARRPFQFHRRDPARNRPLHAGHERGALLRPA